MVKSFVFWENDSTQVAITHRAVSRRCFINKYVLLRIGEWGATLCKDNALQEILLAFFILNKKIIDMTIFYQFPIIKNQPAPAIYPNKANKVIFFKYQTKLISSKPIAATPAADPIISILPPVPQV
jgi:hypothetical protein